MLGYLHTILAILPALLASGALYSSHTNRLYMRELRNEDYNSEFINLLGYLTGGAVPMPCSRFEQILRYRAKNNQKTFVFFNNDTTKCDYDELIGTISILVEKKFNRGGVVKGYVEDVVVDPVYRGKKYASEMLRAVMSYFESTYADGYKLELTCSEDVKPLYESVGFKHKECAMEYRFNRSGAEVPAESTNSDPIA